MRAILIAACVAFLLVAPAPGFVEMSVARAEASGALLLKCRKAVFRKYGRRTGAGQRLLPKNFVVQQVDLCVANGGQVR
jgi:hypothetical protein